MGLSRKFPVIKIDFAGGVLKNRQELDMRILDILHENAEHLGVSHESTDIPGKLGTLIRKAMAKYGQRAVVLVDEYDKPTLITAQSNGCFEMRKRLKHYTQSSSNRCQHPSS
ncbi:AAA family ATPase [Cylindrospermopsis raciborskii DSH]|uniref:AAA family ATPase n=1 Tax=Cylindrospermopsis raciborskii TaxID=77022 RepID=UPI002ED85B94